jgi:predicted nucleic-acid-binding protein
MIVIDTNILIRLLMKDDVRLAKEALAIFKRAEKGEDEIYLDEVVVAETVWVLKSFYKIKKEKIIESIEKILSFDYVISPRKDLITNALNTFRDMSLAYIDCWIYWVNRSVGGKLTTFDENLIKLAK